MTISDNRHFLETLVTAEKVLSKAFSGEVRLSDGEDLGGSNRSKVYRFSLLEGPNDAPASVVVKQAVSLDGETYNPDSPNGPAWRLFNDWAGLQFLSEVADGISPGPQFYGGDRNAGLIVLEDLGTGSRLDQLLQGDDPVAAEEGLLELATRLGKMHSLTIGKQAKFKRIRDSLGPRTKGTDFDSYEWITAAVNKAVNALDISPHPRLDDELAMLVSSLTEPGPFLAYVHTDPCPDNCIRVGSKLRLFDFEVSEFRHALTDGVVGRIHFPTCFCVNRILEHIPPRMEASYRTELVKGCPEAADDKLFYRAVVEACAFWISTMFYWTPIPVLLKKDWVSGISTVRQRILVRFDIFVKTTEEFEHLEAMGATIGNMAAKLRTLWPPEADTMPYYPAFR
jgi:hypothetical protein